MPSVLLAAAVDTESGSYKFGEVCGFVVIVAALVGAIVFAYRRHRADQVKARQDREHQAVLHTQVTRTLPGRITYADGRSEDFQIPVAQLPDVVTMLVGLPRATAEVRDRSRGTILIEVNDGMATVSWASFGGLYRYLASPYAPLDDARYRLGLGDVSAILHAWVANNIPSNHWERAQPGAVPR